MPSALHRSTYSNGPQPASRLRPHAWPLLGRVHGGPRQSFQRSDCDTVPPAPKRSRRNGRVRGERRRRCQYTHSEALSVHRHAQTVAAKLASNRRMAS
eukprot:6210850-Pleurochrysis_carterae.AAC.2